MVNCVYIHIPFCEKKCNYCSFCSFNLIKAKEKYLNALNEEINFLYKNEHLKTIYFGGGTPSLLDENEIETILKKFNFDSSTEVTLELNPHNITYNKLKNLKSLGINRLSVGVQNFNDEILKIIGRTHTEAEIYQTIDNIKKLDFDNFSIDLMYGLPSQTFGNWIETLNCAIEINPSHISLYGLKIEEGTYFYKNPPSNLPNLDIQARMYEMAVEKLTSKYIHYEFSNFAKSKDYISKHNSAYWKCENYYGLGLSASGYIDDKRYTNTFNFTEYIENPFKKDYQKLTVQEKIEEEIFLGLRLLNGIDFEKINKKYNINIQVMFKKEFDKFIKLGYLEKTKQGVKLTLDGVLLSNEILCEFIKV